MCDQKVTIMPRYREAFTIFPRRLKSGRTVWYYRTYTPDGKRTVAHSTGRTNKTQARNYCAELLANGMLCTGTSVSFGVYAEHFYDDSSQWMSDKRQSSNGKARPVAMGTLMVYRELLRNKILPYFSRFKLSDIRPSHIKEFRQSLIEMGMSNSRINLASNCLRVILSYALSDRLITSNPADCIRQMSIDGRSRDAFTEEELSAIFSGWNDGGGRKMFAVVAAVTGMRFSEIRAIRKSNVSRNFINVDFQWDNRSKGLAPVKTGEERKVRIPAALAEILMSMPSDGGGFVFFDSNTTYRREFNMRTDAAQKSSRGLCFHSMRHFFNTYLLASGIPEIKVKSIMGHSSGKGSMTERYANFRPEHFDDVAELQGRLLEKFLAGDENVTPPRPH